MMELIWLIPLLPLLGFLINALLARRLRFPEKLIGGIAATTVLLAFLLSVGATYQYSHWAAESSNQVAHQEQPYIAQTVKYTWVTGGKAVLSQGLQAQKQHVDLQVEWSYQLDRLSSLYLLFITLVGLLIHIFAIGYMRGDPGFARFFAYLNLFMFMMLTLVLGSNLLMLFVGWEGVGLCSYLLIGFYMERPEAANASKKAFIINRIGDFGFILAIIGLFATLGTLQFQEINTLLKSYPIEALGTFGLLSWLALGLFIGATGKSAQIPLFIWLPDAMAGPTPVSALIHAATMVTAGIYLVVRLNVVFQHSLTMMLVMALVGALTALVAATIAMTQNDIKKVLAYSTISQLGYMFLACGAGVFVAGIFHVVTHAFFKAQLFLGAGSVIYALHHEQDMQHMGGLKRYLPTTYKTMLVAWLAICGIFPLAGFWSKDEILAGVYNCTLFGPLLPKVLWLVGLATSGLTAFYMTRLMALTFWRERPSDNVAHESTFKINISSSTTIESTLTIQDNKIASDKITESTIEVVTESESDKTFKVRATKTSSEAAIETNITEGSLPLEKVEPKTDSIAAKVNAHIPTSSHTPHESPAVMTIPLIVLAILAAIGGLIGLPGLNWLEHWLTPMTSLGEVKESTSGVTEILLAAISMSFAVGMAYLAYYIYVKQPKLADEWAIKFRPLYNLSAKRWYWDELLDIKLVELGKKLSEMLSLGDRHFVDSLPNGSAAITNLSSLLSGWLDRYIVDLGVNLIGWFTRYFSMIFRTIQTGLVYNYALIMVLGVVLLIAGIEHQTIMELFSQVFSKHLPPVGK